MPQTDTTAQLLSDFMQPTETKGAETVNPTTAAEPLPDDFAPVVELAPDEDESTVNTQNLLSADTSADLVIALADGVQTLLFSGINRRKINNRYGDKRDRLEVLLDKMANGHVSKADIPEDDYADLLRMRDLLKVQDTIPFSEEEKQGIREPLRKIMQEKGYDIPVGWGITIAFLTALAPRISDAITE